MNQPLSSIRALVTGGSRGIGRAIALALADNGARVAIVHHGDDENARVTLEELRKRAPNATAIDADVSSEKAVVDMIAMTVEALGGIDVVVNNAGILRERPLLETPSGDFDRTIAVNLRGPFLVTREAIRRMVTQGHGGRVINITSDLGHLGRAGHTAYCASKAAVNAMTRTWAREFAPDILVNAIAPGPIDTDMMSVECMTPETLAQETDIPLQRLGQPEEIAAMAVFLAGPGGTFITGQTFGVNGGSVMR